MNWKEPVIYYPDAWILEPILTRLPWAGPDAVAFCFSVVFLAFYTILAFVPYECLRYAGWFGKNDPLPALAMFMGFTMVGLVRANVALAKLMFFQVAVRHLPAIRRDGTR